MSVCVHSVNSAELLLVHHPENTSGAYKIYRNIVLNFPQRK